VTRAFMPFLCVPDPDAAAFDMARIAGSASIRCAGRGCRRDMPTTCEV
jgi:hypothetical protein